MEEILEEICEKSLVKLAGPSDTCVGINSAAWVLVLNLSQTRTTYHTFPLYEASCVFGQRRHRLRKRNSLETGQEPPAHQAPTLVTEEA